MMLESGSEESRTLPLKHVPINKFIYKDTILLETFEDTVVNNCSAVRWVTKKI